MNDFESMYAKYVEETMSASILVTEYGFAQYAISPDGERIIAMDVFVKPEYRGHKLDKDHPFVKLGDAIVEIGKSNGCKFFTGRIDHSNPFKNKVMHCHLWYGMQLLNNEGNSIWTYKEI